MKANDYSSEDYTKVRYMQPDMISGRKLYYGTQSRDALKTKARRRIDQLILNYGVK